MNTPKVPTLDLKDLNLIEIDKPTSARNPTFLVSDRVYNSTSQIETSKFHFSPRVRSKKLARRSTRLSARMRMSSPDIKLLHSKFSRLATDIECYRIVLNDLETDHAHRTKYHDEISEMVTICQANIVNCTTFANAHFRSISELVLQYNDIYHRFNYIKCRISNDLEKVVRENRIRQSSLEAGETVYSLLMPIINSYILNNHLTFNNVKATDRDEQTRYQILRQKINRININNNYGYSNLDLQYKKMIIDYKLAEDLMIHCLEMFFLNLSKLVIRDMIITNDLIFKIPRGIKHLVFVGCHFRPECRLSLHRFEDLVILTFDNCGDLKTLDFGIDKAPNVYQLKIIGNTKFTRVQFKIFDHVKSLNLENNTKLYKYIPSSLNSLSIKCKTVDIQQINDNVPCDYLTRLKIESDKEVDDPDLMKLFIKNFVCARNLKIEYLRMFNLRFNTSMFFDVIEDVSSPRRYNLRHLHVRYSNSDYFERKIEFGDPDVMFRLFPDLESLRVDGMMLTENEIVQIVANLSRLKALTIPDKIYLTRRITEFIRDNYSLKLIRVT